MASGRDVTAITYMTSRHVSFGFASNASAMMPAAIGAAADVPVCLVVHLFLLIIEKIRLLYSISFKSIYLKLHIKLYMDYDISTKKLYEFVKSYFDLWE